MIRSLQKLFQKSAPESAPCNLRIGSDPQRMTPVADPEGLGGYKLALDRFIRDEEPELVLLRSDTDDLSVVRKALRYLSLTGEIGVAEQLPDAEVAAIFGVDERTYQGIVIAPNASAESLRAG